MARIHDMGGPLLKPAVIRVSFGYDAPERPSGIRVCIFDIDDIVGFDWPDTERYVCTIGHLMVNHG